MRCDLCGQDGATLVGYFAGQGEVISKNRLFVCQACAERLSVTHLLSKEEAFHDLRETDGKPGRGREKVCPFCGFSGSDFWEKGLLGCPYCYLTFEGEISQKISQEQAESFHIGKIPARWWKERKLRQNISRVLAELKRCIQEEDYERAEYCKHLINRLRSRLG
ncbi:MAG: hypothetical protein N2Z84_00680 [Atribacterota bacterium]|nr:hypothetical protein [Atribacterota bacterium]